VTALEYTLLFIGIWAMVFVAVLMASNTRLRRTCSSLTDVNAALMTGHRDVLVPTPEGIQRYRFVRIDEQPSSPEQVERRPEGKSSMISGFCGHG